MLEPSILVSWLPLLGCQEGNGHGCFSSSTFTHNMLAFGLNKKLCSDFLKKQAVIGNLDEGKLGWGCWGWGWGARASLYSGASHSVRRRASVTETCLSSLPSFPNPWNVFSGYTTGSHFCLGIAGGM